MRRWKPPGESEDPANSGAAIEDDQDDKDLEGEEEAQAPVEGETVVVVKDLQKSYHVEWTRQGGRRFGGWCTTSTAVQ